MGAKSLLEACLFPPVQLGEEEESEGRCHAPTSVSKTRFTSHTPPAQREAIQQLRQRISFSDQSVRQ